MRCVDQLVALSPSTKIDQDKIPAPLPVFPTTRRRIAPPPLRFRPIALHLAIILCFRDPPFDSIIMLLAPCCSWDLCHRRTGTERHVTRRSHSHSANFLKNGRNGCIIDLRLEKIDINTHFYEKNYARLRLHSRRRGVSGTREELNPVSLSLRNTRSWDTSIDEFSPNFCANSFHKGSESAAVFDIGLMRLFRTAINEFEYVFATIEEGIK